MARTATVTMKVKGSEVLELLNCDSSIPRGSKLGRKLEPLRDRLLKSGGSGRWINFTILGLTS
jgi:hypothetical protein